MSNPREYPLLTRIDSPADLRELSQRDLDQLCDELRRYLVESVSQSGGHFAAGLGALELTVALHYVYNTPHDRIVWDVGHQSYPHKIITGRRDEIGSVRQWDGVSPFPKRSESPFDTFGVGHAGTSIGAALGMALGAQATGQNRQAIAVIGDGGLTCGMAFEALNHAGGIGAPMLVVLNDNEMSISPNVGALTQRFAQVISSRLYTSMREGGKRILDQFPSPVGELARRAEEHVKGIIVPGTLFEEFGFNYIGPIDGHDVHGLINTLRNIRDLEGPQLLHIVTRKGKGYAPAEADPVKYHGISSPFDPRLGIQPSAKSNSPTYSQVFGDWLCDMASADPRVVGITPAMREGSKLERFEREFKQRYFDVGIAEQHSVTVAAGMACEGLKPVVAIYSTFLQRAYDQLVHDVCLQNLPVVFALDRAGLVGGDGPTHNGVYDLSFMRSLPYLTIMAPSDENELRQMLYTGHLLDGPSAVRYPRGTGPGAAIDDQMTALEIGRAIVRRKGKKVAFLAFGPMVGHCMEIASEFDASVIDMRFVKPIDEQAIASAAAEHEYLVTVEENAIQGGAGSAVNEVLMAQRCSRIVLNIGIPDRLVQHGSRGDMLRDAQLDADGIRDQVRELVSASSARDSVATA